LQKYDIFLIYKEKIKIYSAIWQFFIRQFGNFSFGNLAVFRSAVWQVVAGGVTSEPMGLKV